MTRRQYDVVSMHLLTLLAHESITREQYAHLQHELDVLFYCMPAQEALPLVGSVIEEALEITRTNMLFSTNMPLAYA